jgi:hypothetical protein
VDDPLLYHWVLNTDWLNLEEVTELIGQTLLRRFYQD